MFHLCKKICFKMLSSCLWYIHIYIHICLTNVLTKTKSHHICAHKLFLVLLDTISYYYLLKVTGQSKKQKFVGFLPSVQDFLFNMYLFLALVSGHLDLTFHNLSLFCIFSIDFADFKSKRGHIVKF